MADFWWWEELDSDANGLEKAFRGVKIYANDSRLWNGISGKETGNRKFSMGLGVDRVSGE